ncbi:phospho-N-acetylmuramoyl-pentapeptide-transferase [Marinitenerispora sediminis]|uniref:Phospho-N-acetylmuramoyl-pentapeptide-transferase n=1 Tax=Marinitenerispora sediminis TaxID=1931232 RepID=A0A368T5G0_9ACTN|nr:phospho-N-acetylmuramoyl-pentapeptide-transferase [Marinitenerispora sediminis]RCV54490.1 phospho-N-acetylmuramoyl-pentapeptide-transferase [Marinitenerispora sediminis]RCV58925.1 phospho-N-acetylmuramoyl-pentapeptide-transferase [Marinitenerispora sediminis]RCV61354.1 phospho-N-acetylmuramoyl-pentapeptide-transferase [Marinitenerispora sediminis]
MTGILVAAALSLLVSLLIMPMVIRMLYRFKFGQEIRDDGPEGHKSKQGTPTMGGIVIILGAVIGYFGAHLASMTRPTVSGLLVMFLFVGLGAVGFLDDFIKIYKRRSLGLRSGAKMLGQAIVGIGFAVGVTFFPNNYTYTPGSPHLSFLRDFGPALALPVFAIWALFLIVGFSNAVNLTDGLDGLATGATILSLVAYVIIGNWQLRQSCVNALEANCYTVRDPLDLAVVAAAGLGGCIGFLWYNAPPAKIFMGDTGSLALGGLIVGLAITTRTQLLLLIIGGLFVLITLSVMLQIGSFRLTGKRIFRMAPLQHHFELKGWAESTIVIRFWIIQGLFVGVGIGLFYLEWMPR